MHALQPKHSKLKDDEAEKILKNFNIAKSQIPKIASDDPALPEGCSIGDIIKIERKDGDKVFEYYRVVV